MGKNGDVVVMENAKNVLDRLKQKYASLNKISEFTPRELAQMKVDDLNAKEGERHLVDGYNCNICKNKGYIAKIRERVDLRGKEVFEEYITLCKCDTIRRNIMRMKRSGLESLLKKCRFDNYEVDEKWQSIIKDKAINFAKNPELMFYIGGQSGAGKTHLCTAISREFLLQGNELRYVLWRDESVRIKSMMNRDGAGYEKAVEELKRVDVLYIDDFLKVPIGKEDNKPTVADLSLALEIINNRYNAKLITIISSEWTLREVINFDEALGGRMQEMTGVNNCISLKKDRSKNYRLKGMIEL